jgi:ComEC/Rec2-related protein
MKWPLLPCSRFSDFFSLKNRRFPFLGLVLAAIVGILTEEIFSFPSWGIFLGSLLLGGVLLFFIWKNPLSCIIEQGLFFLFIALCFATLHAWQWKESPAYQVASLLEKRGDDIAVEGRVASEVKVSSNHYSSFFLQTDRISELTLPVTMFVHWEGPPLLYGERVSLRAQAISPQGPRNPGEFDAKTWLARKEVFTELRMDPSDPGRILSSGELHQLMRMALECRQKIGEWITLGITDDSTAMKLIKAIALGSQEEEIADFIDDFKLTGTMHLFAVSGLHVGMLAVIIWFFLKMLRLPRWSAVLVTIPLLFFYVAITGFRIGSLRAAFMSSLFLIGFLVSRRPQMINSLAAAAFCLLLSQTNLLFSIGWQFSFCVVFSILFLATPFQKILHPLYKHDPFLPKRIITPFQKWRYDLCHHLSQLVAVSAAAWIGSLLPTLFYFHLLSFSSLVANVLAVPIAFLILALAVLAVLVAPFFPWVAPVFNNSNWLCSKALLMVVHGCSLLPLSSFSVGFSMNRSPKLTIFDFPSAQAAMLQADGRGWMINAGSSKNGIHTLLPFFAENGISALQGIVITEKRAATIGGLAPLLEEIQPSSFFSSEEKGNSFVFKHFLRKLGESGRQLTVLREGDQLNFSPSCSAEVLYPPAGSSDSALVLKFHLGKASLLWIPNSSVSLQTWLLEHSSLEKLHATILLFPSMEKKMEEDFIKAVAPRCVILGNDPFKKHHSSPSFQELESSLYGSGITVLDQVQTGAIILEVLRDRVRLHQFLDHKDWEILNASSYPTLY